MLFIKRKYRKLNKISYSDLDMDDVLLDAFNLPGMDRTQLEGKFNKNISNFGFYLAYALVLLIVIFFIYTLYNLQLVNGEKYMNIALNNSLRKEPIFAKRGVIKDRFGRILAANELGSSKYSENDGEETEIFRRK